MLVDVGRAHLPPPRLWGIAKPPSLLRRFLLQLLDRLSDELVLLAIAIP
jgi:hypothetical protein